MIKYFNKMENTEQKQENQAQESNAPAQKQSAQGSQQQQYQQSLRQSPQQTLEDRKGSAMASFVLGFFSFIPLVGFITFIIGLILGILGLKSSKRGFAIAGIMLCIVGQIAAVIIIISLGVFGVKKVTTEVKEKALEGTMETFADGAREYYEFQKTYIGFESDKVFNAAKKAIDFGGGKNFAVYTSKNAYCAEVQKKNEKWLCIDAKNVSKEYENNPTCSESRHSCN